MVFFFFDSLGISSNVVISGGNCFLLLLITWEFNWIIFRTYKIPYLEKFHHIFVFIFTLKKKKKGIERNWTIWNFIINFVFYEWFSCFRFIFKMIMWVSLFNIMKDEHLFNVFIFSTFIYLYIYIYIYFFFFFWIVFPFG